MRLEHDLQAQAVRLRDDVDQVGISGSGGGGIDGSGRDGVLIVGDDQADPVCAGCGQVGKRKVGVGRRVFGRTTIGRRVLAGPPRGVGEAVLLGCFGCECLPSASL